MDTSDRAEFNRLILQIERDLVSQAHLRTLLGHASTTVAYHLQELRTVEARIRRTRRVSGTRARRS
jgi:biotin operon repressor